MKRRLLNQWLLALAASVVAAGRAARPGGRRGADALIKRLSEEVLDTIQADKAMQAGDVSRIIALVDEKVMPNVNFQRMTASAVGPGWRQATPEQQKRLQESSRSCWCAPMPVPWARSKT